MTDITGDKRVRYGNWMPTNRATVGGLNIIGWAILVAGLILSVFAFILGRWEFGLVLIICTFLIVLFFELRMGTSPGRTIAQMLGDRLSGTGRAASGAARYHTGLFSNLPGDSLTALPGYLAQMREIDGLDGRGEPYTLLYHPHGGVLVAVLACTPDGTQLQTQHKIDRDVSNYGGWIASLSHDAELAGAVVVVDSALRSSEPLVAKIAADIDPDAPAIAREATLQAARALPARYNEMSTWVAIAWKAKSLADKVEDAAAEVAARLPYHVAGLRNAGGGSVVLATSEMLAATVRVAYDPLRSTELASDELAGLIDLTKVSEAGPEYFNDDARRVVMHDGNASMTVLVTEPPKLHITEQSLAPLFGPAEKFLRKRVATFYRPVSPAATISRVETLNRASKVAASSKARASGEDRQRVEHAEKLESEIVAGASLTRFAMAVTVTFEPNARAYRAASLQLKSLLDSSSLRWRFCDWDSGPAFHTTLPLGVLPWLYETAIERYTNLVA